MKGHYLQNSPKISQSLDRKKSLDFFKRVKLIGEGKFKVYLVESFHNHKNYALKVYGHVHAEPNPSFVVESKFSWLSHKHVVQIIESAERKIDETTREAVSYTLMEYALYGDFASIALNNSFSNDEKLIRTYFHQLIKGLEYLHQNGVAHMDIKPENLLLGEDYALKISDFDSSYLKPELKVKGHGTPHYRAPEVLNQWVKDPFAADIYSVGVTLFCLITTTLPYAENSLVDGFDLHRIVLDEDESFWKIHASLSGAKEITNHDFQTLFWSMVKANPSERATLKEIKGTKWYQGPIYSDKELQAIMKKLWAC